MRRLSIIDVEGGAQPVWNEDETVAVVFNGEIYNYIELSNELQGRGHQFRTRSDTEVLVHLYEEYGVDMVARLRGRFALAIWDRPRRRMFVARDHVGIKPLYWTRAEGAFVCASEIKALFAFPGVRREADPEAAVQHLTLR